MKKLTKKELSKFYKTNDSTKNYSFYEIKPEDKVVFKIPFAVGEGFVPDIVIIKETK